MNIDKLRDQHVEILGAVSQMRKLVRSGIAENADTISRLVISISGIIKLHLAREDSHLYPALAAGGQQLAALGSRYQHEMGGIAGAYMDFSRKWNTAREIHADPEGFRAEANIVFKALHQRIQQENIELYPAIALLA